MIIYLQKNILLYLNGKKYILLKGAYKEIIISFKNHFISN